MAAAAIHALQLDLWAHGCVTARAGIVVIGGDLPELIMVNGTPFIRDPSLGELAYRRVKPYCINAAD